MAFIGSAHFALSLTGSYSLTSSGRRSHDVRPVSRRNRAARVLAMAAPVRTVECDTPVKVFLDQLKPLGSVRLISNSGAVVMEAIATFDDMFFASLPKGEYANLIKPKENIDLHILLDSISGARFEIGVSRTPSKVPTYAIRLLGKDKTTVVLSVFLQWDKEPEDIATDRVDHWKKLKADYAGSDDTFLFN